MSSRLTALTALLALLLLPAAAHATCNLSMTLDCGNLGGGQGGTCTATTLNSSGATCFGQFFTGFTVNLPPGTVSMGGLQNTLGLHQCIDSGIVPGLTTSFAYCFGFADLGNNQSFTSTVRVTPGPNAPSSIPIVAATIVFDEHLQNELGFAYAFNDSRVPTCTPTASVSPISRSGVAYTLTWSAVPGQNQNYEVRESTSPDFTANLVTVQVNGTSRQFTHTVDASTTYYYSVRSTACGGQQPGPLSNTVQIVVQAPPAPEAKRGEAVLPLGSTTPVGIRVFIPGSNSRATSGRLESNDDPTFSASIDKPYLSVSPSSGTIPPQGTTVTVTGDPSSLPPGASTGTLGVTSSTGNNNVPISISLVTPVSPQAKSAPPSSALIIPVVTHVNNAAAEFQSDVRLTNAGTSDLQYQIALTPTRSDASNSKITTIRVPAGDTIALNDIAKNFFGFGATGAASDVGFGALEIRPLNSSGALTYAASRTFATTAIGTLGQFIAAIPLQRFPTRVNPSPLGGAVGAIPRMSLQQVAQSAKFRTNLGLVEGSGAPASGNISVYDGLGTRLAVVPYSLKAGEHQQLNSFLSTAGINNLEDGRIEITVESSLGAVTAYASVLDNKTTDPLAVLPVEASSIRARRYVVPGMADLDNGPANFHSDLRIYNGGLTETEVSLSYYPQGAPASVKTATPIRIPAGQVRAIDNVLPTLFATTASGGSIVLTTAADSSLVTTGRTYSIDSAGGTFGQFIPGVTPAEGIGVGDRALQILQLEQSQQFRSNLGLAEITGFPATVRVRLHLPDSKTTPQVEVTLAPNEFRQLSSVIAGLNPGVSTYNARVSVTVLSGTGRVTAYGSVIDNATQDPTYVPAQ